MDSDTPHEDATEHHVIVIALDHSKEAVKAVQYYVRVLHRHGNHVLLVHCVELPEGHLGGRDWHSSSEAFAAAWKSQEAKSKVLEHQMKDLLANTGISATLRTCVGKPGETVCQVADEVGASLIVTGSRGLGKVRRTVLGSVSDYLVQHAHCPVVVCRERALVGSPGLGPVNKPHPSGDQFIAIRERLSSTGERRPSEDALLDDDDAS